MNTKLKGIVDGKMIVEDGNNQMYIYSTADIIGNKTLNDGDRVAFEAQGVRAVEIEKAESAVNNAFLEQLSKKVAEDTQSSKSSK